MLPTKLGDYPRSVGTSNRHWPNVTGALTWVHTFSSTTTNEVLLNASRDYHRRGSGDFHTNYAAALGLPNPLSAFNWPALADMDLGAYPFGSQAPFWLITNYGVIQDNATKIKGKHELEFGFHIKYELIDKSVDPGSVGFGPVGVAFQNTVSSTALSPDGLPNYGLRSVPKYVAGVNTPDSIINITDTRLLSRGFPMTVRDPHLSDGRVQDWNLTIEKEVMSDTVARIGYIGNYGDKQQQAVRYNDSTPAYIWYATQKTPLPTGEFASVATRPYDQRAYGDITVYTPAAYGRYNGAQFELERRYSKGFAYQILWNIGNSIWIGRDNVDVPGSDTVPSINTFLPGAVPADFDARLRFLNYARGPNTLKHQIRWNFIADLPLGRGKKLLSNSKGVLEHLVGGWQVAGLGSTRTSYWTLPTTVYPIPGNPIEVYGYKYPIVDCQSGTCYPGYLWWNGYIPANKINSRDASGKPNGIMGAPANYKPAAAPLIPWGQTTLPANAPAGTNISSFWDTNNVWIPLSNGTVQRQLFNDNLHPWRNQYMDGPWQWFQDASLFKFWSIKERLSLRFNLDFFNLFNHPNNPTAIAENGILSTRNSGSNARVTQLGLRLLW